MKDERLPQSRWLVRAATALLVAGCSGGAFSNGSGRGQSGAGGAEASASGGASARGSADGGGRAGASAGGATAGGASGAGGGGTGLGGGAGSTGTGGASADAGPSCDPQEAPGDGVFVSTASGDDSAGAGTRELPLRTIVKALAVAGASGKKTVFLDQGTYTESVSITDANAGVTLRGGFKASGTSWHRDCAGDARTRTVIASPTSTGVLVTTSSSRAVLQTLTVLTRSPGESIPGASGETCYGVFVSGDTALAALDDVSITAGAGGLGGAVTERVAAPQATCLGVGDCGTGASAGGSAAGAMPGKGTFSSTGYAPANGNQGQFGSPGENGTPGADGTSASCHLGSGCSGGTAACVTLTCSDQYGTGKVQSGAGRCGCGGSGGGAGAGGMGGGASVALFVTGANAAVSVTRSVLLSKDGGDGSPGIDGGEGAAGTAGSPGEAATCWGACQSVGLSLGSVTCSCQQPSTYYIAGGTAGGPGGSGGPGGRGSGGAGGPSIGVVRVGGAVVTLDAASSVHVGSGGKGADGSPDGAARQDLAL